MIRKNQKNIINNIYNNALQFRKPELIVESRCNVGMTALSSYQYLLFGEEGKELRVMPTRRVKVGEWKEKRSIHVGHWWCRVVRDMSLDVTLVLSQRYESSSWKAAVNGDRRSLTCVLSCKHIVSISLTWPKLIIFLTRLTRGLTFLQIVFSIRITTACLLSMAITIKPKSSRA